MSARLISPTLQGNQIQLPISKSVSNRELVLHGLLGELPDVAHFSTAADTVSLHQMLSNDGPEWNAGLGGTTIRFGLAALCAMGRAGVLTGEPPLLERPIGPLVEALRQLGFGIDYLQKEGYPPLELTGGSAATSKVTIDPSVSSQFVSALLLIGSFLPNGLTLEYDGVPVSVPYLDLTIEVVGAFGGEIDKTEHGYVVHKKSLRIPTISADRDWSAAAFWYAMVGMSKGASIVMPGLSADSTQGDKIVQYIFNRLGVHSHVVEAGIKVENRSEAVEAFEHDFSGCPDLAQAVAVFCACKGVPATLKGLGTLRHKETDRIAALETELTRLGIEVNTGDDWLQVAGTIQYNNEPIETYNDHRMAMAFAVASFVVDGLRINDPEVVEKSYPEFWNEFQKAGGKLLM